MIFISIMTCIFIYVVICIFILLFTSKFSLKLRNVLILIFVLIPIWDIVIGYPVFYYYSLNESGIKIYKTFDNIDSFEVKGSGIDSIFYNFASNYLFSGYENVQFKDLDYDRYFKYYFDSIGSKYCTEIKYGFDGKKRVELPEDKCVAKADVEYNNLSRFLYEEYPDFTVSSLLVIKRRKIIVFDKANDEILAETVNFRFGMGWLCGVISSIETGNRSWATSIGPIDFVNLRQEMLFSTLKVKGRD